METSQLHHGKWYASKMHPTCHDVIITYMKAVITSAYVNSTHEEPRGKRGKARAENQQLPLWIYSGFEI